MPFPQHFSLSDFENSGFIDNFATASGNPTSINLISRKQPDPDESDSSGVLRRDETRMSKRRFQNKNATTTLFPKITPRSESEGPFPLADDYDHLDASPTCGVPRITALNRNGIAMRILGGQEAKQGRWPWQVAVLNKMNVNKCTSIKFLDIKYTI